MVSCLAPDKSRATTIHHSKKFRPLVESLSYYSPPHFKTWGVEPGSKVVSNRFPTWVLNQIYGKTPKSSILIRFSINKPSILGVFPPIFGSTPRWPFCCYVVHHPSFVYPECLADQTRSFLSVFWFCFCFVEESVTQKTTHHGYICFWKEKHSPTLLDVSLQTSICHSLKLPFLDVKRSLVVLFCFHKVLFASNTQEHPTKKMLKPQQNNKIVSFFVLLAFFTQTWITGTTGTCWTAG